MGYETRFFLDWSGATDAAQEEAIRQFVRTSDGARYCLGEDAKSHADSGKWYNWKNDLKKWSLEFPHIRFQMNGEGAESGDIWVAYAKGGAIQYEQARLTFAPCKL